MKYATAVLVVVTLLTSPPLRAGVDFESVTFIANDGHSFVSYLTTRSDQDSYTLHVDKDTALSDFLYINPNDFSFDTTQAENNLLKFPQGNYATLEQGDYLAGPKPLVSIDDAGIYTLNTWDQTTLANGHFGFWNQPGNFSNFAAVWVLPDHYEVLDYRANKPGEWVKRGNTLTFFATDQNDLTFAIRYQPSIQPLFNALQSSLQDVQAVEVVQSSDTVTVTFDNEILFASGSAEVAQAGEAVIGEIAPHLKTLEGFQVVIAGHTDNNPIRGQLQNRFPSNWELSAIRAVNVTRALQDAGIPGAMLKAEALGEYSPKNSNATDAERQANRRTEIRIEPLAD